jgi:hypothetical protein
MTTRSTLANLAGGIAGLGLLLDRLFNPAICSLYQLSGPAVWEQLSSLAVWEQLSGLVVWEQLSGPAVWEQLSSPVVWERLYGLAVWEVPGGLDNVPATIFSLPGIYLMAAVNSAT